MKKKKTNRKCCYCETIKELADFPKVKSDLNLIYEKIPHKDKEMKVIY